MTSIRFNALLVTLLVLGGSVKSKTPLNFTEMTLQNGYESEEHTVITDDGYVLTIFRITKGARCNHKNKKTPVFFMPPLLSCADSALEPGVDAALPYLISDACFDTWVGNPRGTYYGRKHIRLDPDKDKEFWSFSMDEIGAYDVPAMVDYVLNKTGVDKLMFIGFSQGGGSFFIMCSERPGHCEKIKLMIGLAPTSRLFNSKSRILRELLKNVENNLEVFDDRRIWELFGRDEVMASLSMLCTHTTLCEYIVDLADSRHPGSIARATYQTMLERFPTGTSVQNIVRFSQSARSRKFMKFSYGKEKNQLIYGRSTPPEYNLTAANVPILLMTGKSDSIVDVKDVKWLASELPNVKEFVVVEDPLWNHIDMFYSQLIKATIFPKIREYFLHYNDT